MSAPSSRRRKVQAEKLPSHLTHKCSLQNHGTYCGELHHELRAPKSTTSSAQNSMTSSKVGAARVSCWGSWTRSPRTWKKATKRTLVMDFSKAFDKVCHSLLIHTLRKLQDCGPSKQLDPQLPDRSQTSSSIVINSITSDFIHVESGVPRDSVLGPCLFLLCIAA